MNPDRKRWLWRGVKLALGVTVLVFVGIHFHHDLSGLDFDAIEWRPGWLVASAVIYLAALFPSGWFWRHLHQHFGYPVSLYGAQRAQYVGQLGKYVPGKALAILIRAHLIHPAGVPYGVSIIASFYEVLTGMTAGALMAAAIFALDPPAISRELMQRIGVDWNPAWLGLLLVAVCGVPLVPGVFNFAITKLTARIQAIELYRLPPVRLPTLAIGLLSSSIGWGMQGVSVWAMLQAVVPEPPDLSLQLWAQCSAAIAFSNVAGFVVIFIPAGFGVREELMRMLLGIAGPREYIAVAVLMLRLDWIVAEVVAALVFFWIKPWGEPTEPQASDTP